MFYSFDVNGQEIARLVFELTEKWVMRVEGEAVETTTHNFLPSLLTSLGKMMTTVALVSQYGDVSNYRHRMASPFGNLFCQYLEDHQLAHASCCYECKSDLVRCPTV
jgi:hypothetical protein